jgi:hypothetical protein
MPYPHAGTTEPPSLLPVPEALLQADEHLSCRGGPQPVCLVEQQGHRGGLASGLSRRLLLAAAAGQLDLPLVDEVSGATCQGCGKSVLLPLAVLFLQGGAGCVMSCVRVRVGG